MSKGKLKNFRLNIFVLILKMKPMVDSTQKDQLIARIRQIEDPELFNEIRRLLEIEFDDKPFMTDELQKETIRRAQEQIKNGEVIDEGLANNQIDEWLNE